MGRYVKIKILIILSVEKLKRNNTSNKLEACDSSQNLFCGRRGWVSFYLETHKISLYESV